MEVSEPTEKIEACGEFVDTYYEQCDKLKQTKTVKPVFIGAAVLMAGFIRNTNFVARINERFGKNEKLCKVNVGEALAVMLMMLAAGLYQSLSDCAIQVKNMPLVNLLGLDPLIESADFSRHVMGRALAIFAEEGQQFFNEFVTSVYLQLGLTDVIEVHVDSTSMYFYKVDNNGDEVPLTCEEVKELMANMPLDKFNAAVATSRCELEKEQQELAAHEHADTASMAEDAQSTGSKHKNIRILRGHSKDHRPDLGQIVICSVVEGTYGIPLYTTIEDGNSSDRPLFAKVASEALPILSEQFKNLHYWVSDSAGCTQDSFDAVAKNNVAIVTRAPDNLCFTKEIYEQVQDNPELLKSFLNESGQGQYALQYGEDAGLPKAHMCQGKLFGYDVVALVVCNPNLAKTKEPSETKKAEAELAKLTKELNKRYKCQADADAQAKKLIATAEYCEVELKGYDGKEVNAKPGPQPQDPAKRKTKLVNVKVLANVKISQTKLKEAIEHECFYVLVTTDTEREWTPLDLYNMYKRNSHIETLWRMQKNHDLFINRFFLQNNDRIEGLAILLSLGAFAHTTMQAVIRRAVDAGKLKLPDDEQKAYDPKPTLARICRYFKRVQVAVSFKLMNGIFDIELSNIDGFVGGVLACLGESWLTLCRPETYEGLFAMQVWDSN